MEMHVEPGIQTHTKRNPGRQENLNSMLWEHFTIETVSPGCKRACCKHCKKSYAYITGYKVVGTSHLKRHIANGGCPVVVGNHNQAFHDSSASPTTDPPSMEMHTEPVDTPPVKCSKRKSMVWEHFTIETVRPGCKRARCKHCKKSYAYINGCKKVGTSHLKRHIVKDWCADVVRNQKQDPPTPLGSHELSVGPTENNALVNMEMHIEPGIQTRSKRNPGVRTKNVNTRSRLDKSSEKDSMIWEHFTIEAVSPGCKRVCCKQCKKSYAYINGYKVVGTSHFKRHITNGGCSVVLGNQNHDQDTETPLSKMVPTENNALVIYEAPTPTPMEPVDLGIPTNNVKSPPAKRRKIKSMVWEHFTIETVSPGCRRASCKQCKQSFAYSVGSKVAGTSHLKRHIAKGGCSLVRNQKRKPQTPCSAPSTMAQESSAEGPGHPTQVERIASLEAEVRRLGEELREVKMVLQAVCKEAPRHDQP